MVTSKPTVLRSSHACRAVLLTLLGLPVSLVGCNSTDSPASESPDGGTVTVGNGAEWREIDSGPGSSFYAVWAPGNGTAYLIDSSGNLFCYDGESFSPIVAPSSVRFFHSISGVSPTHMYLTAEMNDGQSTVFHFDGSSWSDLGAGRGGGIWARAVDDVFLAAGNLLHYDGSVWSTIYDRFLLPPGLDYGVTMVVPFDSNRVACVAFDTSLSFMTLCDFESCDRLEPVVEQETLAAWGAGDGVVFFSGGDNGEAPRGEMFRCTSDGCASQGILTDRIIFGMTGCGPSDVYAVGGLGDEGVILHYEGSEWKRLDLGLTRTPFAASCGSDGVVFAVGEDGLVLRYGE